MTAAEPPPATKTACRPCQICGCVQVEILRHQPFTLPEGHLLPDAFDVVSCRECGFCYADTPAAQADYDRYYAEFSKYEDDRTSTGGGGSPEDAYRFREMAAHLAAALSDCPQASVLDIGCSNGGLLQALQATGIEDLTGVDPSAACVANTARHPGLRALQGSLTALPSGLGQYDLVVFSHVLEHVADLRGVLAPLSRLLTARGRLYVEVPDASRYTEFVAAPFQDFNVEHINHFSLASLQNLFLTHGFSLEKGGQLTWPVPQGLKYPAVYGFFQLAETGETAEPPPADFALRDDLRAYIARSERMMDAIEQKLAPLAVPEAGPVIVWGTGQLALKLLSETSLRRAKIAAFVDGNPINQGKVLCGVRVLAPAELKGLPPYPVLITTQLHYKAILAALRDELCLNNPVVTL